MANPGLNYGSNLQHEIGGVLGMLATGIKRVIGRHTATPPHRHTAVGARTLTDAVVDHGTEVQGKYLGECQIKPMAPFLYTQEDEAIAVKLWEEMLVELSCASARDMITQIGK
ncbi:hypothetical protein BDV97DRAFT_401645 [Delphinella strobiligena]|nr:hypothetical protein BDV97DRAFT_401645 [Delphinella strobiligena]